MADLHDHDLKTLMAAVTARLVAIEAEDLERDLLRARPPASADLHPRLSRLLRAARDHVNGHHGHSNESYVLSEAVQALYDITVAGDRDLDAPDDAPRTVGVEQDDIYRIGWLYDVTEKRYAELQHLYGLRMEFTREEIRRVHVEAADARSAADTAIGLLRAERDEALRLAASAEEERDKWARRTIAGDNDRRQLQQTHADISDAVARKDWSAIEALLGIDDD